jgi:GntR family transcriptional regulator, transcriptional repressor for pyruvate dehydrogenase complex
MNSFNIGRIKRVNVTELAIQCILDLIRRRVLRPGDRLPSQRELVVQMGLSHTAVREALRGLASMGVLEIQPGRGVFVRSISSEMLINPESLFFNLQREALLDAIEVRRVLEVEAIGLAAERATAEDLRQMERILKQIEERVHSDEDPSPQEPVQFHLAIAKATHNVVLTNMVKSFAGLLMRGAEVIVRRVPEIKVRDYRMHLKLYKCVLRREPEEARRCMREHLEESKELILQGFSEIEKDPVRNTVLAYEELELHAKEDRDATKAPRATE